MLQGGAASITAMRAETFSESPITYALCSVLGLAAERASDR